MTIPRPGMPMGAMLALAAAPLLVGGLLFTGHELGASRARERTAQAATLTALLAQSAERALPGSSAEQGSLVTRFAEWGRRSLGIEYAMIVDREGRILDHTDLGRIHTVADPGAWREAAVAGLSTGEKPVVASGGRVLEFAAPILSSQGPVGAAIIGIRRRADPVALADVRPFMLPALFMLLMIPCAFVIMRISVRPLLATGEELRALLAAQSIPGLPALAGAEPGAVASAMRELVREFLRVFRDQEEKRQSLEIALRVQEFEHRRLETLIERVPDGLVLEGTDGRVEFMNRAAESLLGVNREEVLAGEAGAEALRTGEPGASLSVSALPLYDGQRTQIGTVHLVRDLSGSRMAERAQHEFVSHLAHEVKSPLNTIRSYAEMLLDGEIADVETRKEFFNTINEEAARLARLVENLMHLSRIEMGQTRLERQFVKIANLVDHAVGAVSPLARAKALELRVATPDRLGSLSGDRQLLEVALINVLGNAVKYTPSGGLVAVTVEERPGELAVTVLDNGPGIAAQDRERIFEKFFRSSAPEVAAQPGHGLGLPLAREILELHGGSILVKSEPGRGAAFTLTVPLAAGGAAPPPADSGAGEAALASAGRS